MSINKKHQQHINEVFLYIHNRIMVGTDPIKLRDEVIVKFSVELAFYDCSPLMIQNFIEELCLQAYFYANKEIYEGGPNGPTISTAVY